MRIAQWKDRLAGISFQTQMTCLFSIFTVATIGFIAMVSILSTSALVEESTERYVELSASSLNTNLNLAFEEAISSTYIGRTYAVSAFLNTTNAEELYRYSKELGSLIENWRQVQNANSPIQDLTFISVLGHGYSEKNGFFYLEQAFADYLLFQELAQSPRELSIWGTPDNLQQTRWEENSLGLATGIFKIGTNELAGFIRVSLRKDFVSQTLSDSMISENGRILVVDTQGHPVLQEQEHRSPFSADTIQRVIASPKDGGIFYDQVDGDRSLIVHSPLGTTGWIMVSSVPAAELISPISTIRNTILVVAFIAFLLALTVNALISRGISRPITRLSKLMGEAANGNFSMEVPAAGQKEIRQLYHSFDRMLREIKKLMARVIDEQENLKRAELQALQEQINPHFLYNSMDSAVWAAETGDNEQVVDLLISLSRFYKLTLSGGESIVTMEMELDHARSYLEVVGMRYQDLLTYRFDIEEGVLAGRFPKIILQPLVENAVYHGIKPKRFPPGEQGLITIEAHRVREGMTIAVRDNGLGMEPGMPEALGASADSYPSGAGYGLRNIQQRIGLFFGKEYRLQIDSAPEMGTTISVTVPFWTTQGEERAV